MSASRIVVACLMSGALVACTSTNELQQRFAYRWGPDPGIPSSGVQTAIGDQIATLNYITESAFGVSYAEIPPLSDKWFDVTEWGFNVGRRDCEIYMDYMFRLNREKARDDGIIAGLAAATASIVGVSAKSPAKTLSVLAASFGLATALNDAIFQSYLFSEAPGLISVKVKQLQDKYQQQVEKTQVQTGAKATPTMVKTSTTTNKTTTGGGSGSGNSTDNTTTVVLPIKTAEQAYSAIQNYYNICLPHSIEGVLLQAVANTTAKSSSPSNNSTPTLQQQQTAAP